LEGLAVEDVGIFYEHLVHFTVFCYVLWTFGKNRGNLVYFLPFCYFCTKKNLATLPRGEVCPLGGMFTPSFTPRVEHSLLFRRIEGKQRISPPGDNFTPRGQNSPLGVKVCPWGEVKNVPLARVDQH
jgi:hypothetical protein